MRHIGTGMEGNVAGLIKKLVAPGSPWWPASMPSVQRRTGELGCLPFGEMARPWAAIKRIADPRR
jgi:hypothetical protein